MSIEELRDEVEEHQEDTEQVDNELLDDEQDIEDGQGDEQDADGEEAESEDDSADDALDFSFDDDGDSSDPFKGQEAPEWVKKVREENRELKRQLKQQQQPNQQQALREMPTLEDHEFDEDGYREDYAKWYEEKQQYEQKAQAEQQRYKQYDERYSADREAVTSKVPNYNEIEQSVAAALPESKQAILKIACKNPARMVLALERSPAKLEELSNMNEVEFVYHLGQMELNMSNVKRNPSKPRPKSHSLEGSAGGGDTQLAKLEAAADKSGDRSAVIAYKRKMKNK